MRKISVFSKIFLSGIATVMLLSSCKKDELNSTDLLVYMQGDYGSTNNSVTASLIQTPIAVWGNTTFNVPVFSTREVTADVSVTVTPAPSLVDQFNTANGKKALLLPSANYQINSSQHTIQAGTFQSDPLTIKIVNPANLTDTNGYVLPLTISAIAGKDKGVQISSNRATTYFYVPYNYTNVDTVQTPLTGTLMARTAWTVSVSGTTTGALGPAMLDGNNSTAWRSSNSTTRWAILNMGSQQTVKGFQIVPDYVTTSENPTQMTISTSNDGVNFTVQGIWKGTGPAGTSSATAPDIKGVNFLAPVKAQYFRFDITAVVSGTRTGIGELNAVQ